MSKKRKVLFILPTLRAGGAEKIISFVSHTIDNSRFDSKLLIIGPQTDAAYETDPKITYFLNKSRVLVAIPQVVLFLIKYKPDVVLSSIGHLNTIMGLISPIFPKTKFIIREASVISSFKKFIKKNNLYDYLSKKSYPMVDAVICQSKDMANDFRILYNIPSDKLFIINNPITRRKDTTLEPKISNDVKQFITIGRLSPEKGHEPLLRMLSKINIDFHYTIVGDGPERETLLELIQELGLSDKITHIAYTNNAYPYLRASDILLQGSYVEGFPNVVLESCSVGTPVIAFDVPGGTKEIIIHDINGFLVNEESEFIRFLTLFKDWQKKTIMDSVKDRFSEKTILGQYERLFERI